MTHRVAITGYDLRTRAQVVEIYVSPSVVEDLRKLVGVPDSDPDILGSYPIDVETLPPGLRDALTPKRASLDLLDFFLESWET